MITQLSWVHVLLSLAAAAAAPVPTLSISPLRYLLHLDLCDAQQGLASPGLLLLLNPEKPFQSAGNATPLLGSALWLLWQGLSRFSPQPEKQNALHA